jgi:hypothetical protein
MPGFAAKADICAQRMSCRSHMAWQQIASA